MSTKNPTSAGSSCSKSREKNKMRPLLCVIAKNWKETTLGCGTCNSPWKVWQSLVTRRGEWKKHDKKLISVLKSVKSFSLNLERDTKKIASIIFLSVLRLLWYVRRSRSYFTQIHKGPLSALCFLLAQHFIYMWRIMILHDIIKVRLFVPHPLPFDWMF